MGTHSSPRRHVAWVLLVAALLLSGNATRAQVPDPVKLPTENALARARAAAALRDSLLKFKPAFEATAPTTLLGLGSDSVVERRVRAFLATPYEVPEAPTLNELDAVAAAVNLGLANERQKRLKELVQAGGGLADALGASTGEQGPGVGAALTPGVAWLPTEAQLIGGLTDFMIERAKDEVAFSFVLNLRGSITGDRWIQVGLPRSYDLMNRIDTETFQTFMPLLRSAFVEDLNELPGRIDVVMDATGVDPTYKPYLQGLAIAFERGLEIRRGAPPAVALANLVQVGKSRMDNDVARRSLQLIGLLAREYAAGGGEPFIQELANRDRGWLRRYFVALIAHDAVALDPHMGTFRNTFLAQLKTREADAILLLNQLHSAQGMLRDLRTDADSARNALDRVLTGAGGVLQVLQTGERFLIFPGQTSSQGVQLFQSFVADATTLHQALSERDYGAVVTWLVRRPELQLCGTGESKSLALLREAEAKANREADQLDAVENLRDSVARSSRNRGADQRALARREQQQKRRREGLVSRAQRELFSALLAAGRDGRSSCEVRMRYLSFASSLAAARNAEEVTLALRTASAPVGSYRAKRNQEGGPFLKRWGPASVSAVGYPGLAFGWERAGGGLPSSQDANHTGLSLPVGVELSWGSPLGAFSLFAPMLDLGALASARFNDDDSDTTQVSSNPEIGFKQVFAPGLFFMVNARGWPVSVGFGLQSIGDLREREVTDAAGNVIRREEVDVVRASFIVGVDATLFHFRF